MGVDILFMLTPFAITAVLLALSQRSHRKIGSAADDLGLSWSASGNLLTSLVLVPLAPIGVELGHFLHHRVSDRFFFRLMYVLLFVVGLKLIYDGLSP